jgi:hypothetical protein
MSQLIYPYVLAALQISSDQYSLASLRYDLSKLRAKALVEKLPKSRRYRLWPQGYSICLVFLKLFERVYSSCFLHSVLSPGIFGDCIKIPRKPWVVFLIVTPTNLAQTFLFETLRVVWLVSLEQRPNHSYLGTVLHFLEPYAR